jgi:hypothetical protein
LAIRRTREQWAALVAAFEQTNEQASRFCASRGIRAKPFAWWRWRLRDTSARPQRRDEVKLLPVAVVKRDAGSGTQLMVSVADVEILFDVGAEVDYIATLVARFRGP